MRGRNMDIKDIRKNLEKKQETKEEEYATSINDKLARKKLYW